MNLTLAAAVLAASISSDMVVETKGTVYECPYETQDTCLRVGRQSWVANNGEIYLPGEIIKVRLTFKSLDHLEIPTEGKHDDIYQVTKVDIL